VLCLSRALNEDKSVTQSEFSASHSCTLNECKRIAQHEFSVSASAVLCCAVLCCAVNDCISLHHLVQPPKIHSITCDIFILSHYNVRGDYIISLSRSFLLI